MRDFGVWAMIAFWASALGGILIGIGWARRKDKQPLDTELLIKSLQRRLETGEIDRKTYEKKLHELPGRKP